MKRRLFLLVLSLVVCLLLLPGGIRSAGQPGGGVGKTAGVDPKNFPEKIRANLEGKDLRTFTGVVNSVCAQPPLFSVGVYNQQQNLIMGFLISEDTTDKKQEYLLKSFLLAFDGPRPVAGVYVLTDPGEPSVMCSCT